MTAVQDGDTIRVAGTDDGRATVTLPDGNIIEGPAALLWDLFHTAACDLETIVAGTD